MRSSRDLHWAGNWRRVTGNSWAHCDTAPNEGEGEGPHEPIQACFIHWSGSTESSPSGFAGNVTTRPQLPTARVPA